MDVVNFAGVYFDDRATLHIMYVGDERAPRDRVAALLPVDALVVWTQVERSYGRLRDIRNEIEVLWQQIGLDRINGVSVSASENRVVVATPREDAELQSVLASRYKDAVGFKVTAAGEPLICMFPDATTPGCS
jgi:hypothetical protein